VSALLEPASSGRARCRGCGAAIARGELRFGERLPNPFGDGEMTLWFHPVCAAWKRPEPLLEALAAAGTEVADRESLERAARHALAHRRLPRIDGAERATGSQASCRHCKEPIGKGDWRIRLVFFQDGRFEPGGFVHLACRAAYFETAEVREPVLHFAAGLPAEARAELARALEAPGAAPP
jgi:hypothetical protein